MQVKHRCDKKIVQIEQVKPVDTLKFMSDRSAEVLHTYTTEEGQIEVDVYVSSKLRPGQILYRFSNKKKIPNWK